MTIILEDIKDIRGALLPLTFTRPTALLPAGIGSIADRWQMFFPDASIAYQTEEYLRCKFPAAETVNDDTLHIPGHIIPTPELADAVRALAPGKWIQTTGGDRIFRGIAPQG